MLSDGYLGFARTRDFQGISCYRRSQGKEYGSQVVPILHQKRQAMQFDRPFQED